LARRESTSRALTRSTSALTEFHTLSGHPGTVDACQDCVDQLKRQRAAAAALRAHQRRTRQRIDGILGRRSS
jgi:hypothetical protein